MEGRYLMDTAPPPLAWPLPPVECPSRTVLEVLANKWVLYVLGALQQHDGPMRFNQLGRALSGITQKMLTQTLRTLERDGLVARRVYPTVPPRVEYELTEKGRDVLPVLDAVRAYGDKWMPPEQEAAGERELEPGAAR